MKASCTNNELDKPMQMSLEAIATDLDTMYKDHIRGTNGSHQLNYAFAAGCMIFVIANVPVFWIWEHFKQFLSTRVSRLARIVDIYRPCVKFGSASRTVTALFCFVKAILC